MCPCIYIFNYLCLRSLINLISFLETIQDGWYTLNCSTNEKPITGFYIFFCLFITLIFKKNPLTIRLDLKLIWKRGYGVLSSTSNDYCNGTVGHTRYWSGKSRAPVRGIPVLNNWYLYHGHLAIHPFVVMWCKHMSIKTCQESLLLSKPTQCLHVIRQ